MRTQFIKFFVNGVVLGIISYFLQISIYRFLGGEGNFHYTLASIITYFVLIIVNFYIQKRLIFLKKGLFIKFIIANLCIMSLVSALSPACKAFIELIAGTSWGEHFGFIMAAFIGSYPSFLLNKVWVFNKEATR